MLLVFTISTMFVLMPAWAQVEVPSTALAKPAADAVPACTDHNPMVWHPLAKVDSAGNVVCTYSHDHSADPHELDGLFGPLSTAIPNGQEISYPWQTPNENSLKHEFYKWAVQSNLPSCKPPNIDAANPLSFDAFRAEMHHDGHAGAATRFHSFFLQAHGCDPRDPSWTDGFVSVGGRLDTAFLTVDGNVVPGADDTDLAYENATGAKRIHDSALNPPALTHSTWYGMLGDSSEADNPPGPNRSHYFLTGVLAGDRSVTGPVNPNNVGVYPPDPAHPLQNYAQADIDALGLASSHFGVHLIGLRVSSEFPAPDAQGFVTWDGFVNHNGEFQRNPCEPISSDCVPISIHHMKVGEYGVRNDTMTPNFGGRSSDVLGPDGKSVAYFPN